MLDLNADKVWKQALEDCGKDYHYESNPRPGVIVNLEGNGVPGTLASEQILYLQNQGWSIVTS